MQSNNRLDSGEEFIGVMSYETQHWRLVNVLRRLFGLGALLCGATVALNGVVLLARSSGAVNVDGTLTTAWWPKLLSVIAGIVFVGLGLFCVRSKTYRPDLGDSAWFASPQDARGETRGGRNWWTGDRKASTPRAAV
jgi:hypothetical protein